MMDVEELDAALEKLQYIQECQRQWVERYESRRDGLCDLVARTPLNLDEGWNLYWHVPVVRVKAIADGLRIGGHDADTHRVHLIVGPGPVVDACERCGGPVRRGSRSSTDINDRHWHPVCQECTNQRRASFASEWRDREEHHKRMVTMLRSLPYRDYLKSDHWQEQRLRAKRRAKFRCQLCNTNDQQLDVHHRTYERLGEERSDDLIVLCHECHGRHHGKLA